MDLQKLKDKLPNESVIQQCMHCGMCLSACPTYNLTLNERSSPRGRIRLIKSIADGNLPITETFIDEMNFCLDCQACETACPAGVKYGQMVEAARDMITISQKEPFLYRTIKSMSLRYIVGSRINIKIVGYFLYFYQNYGVEKVINWVLSKIKPLNYLVEMNVMTPRISKVFSDSVIPEFSYPQDKTKVKHKVIIPTGCIMNVAFADINLDTYSFLLANQCLVICPPKQGCCGSLLAHYGEGDYALTLAKSTMDCFMNYEFDYIVSNSAGCAAYMKEYAHLFKDDPEYSEKAKILSSKVKEVTEFISEVGLVSQLNVLKDKITYHDACHSVHTQKLFNEPRKAISNIPDLKIENLEESTWCCGSAGIYNVLRYDDSMKFLERKMANIKKTGAKIVVTNNPGCISQIEYGAKKFNANITVKHPITILNEAVKKEAKED